MNIFNSYAQNFNSGPSNTQSDAAKKEKMRNLIKQVLNENPKLIQQILSVLQSERDINILSEVLKEPEMMVKMVKMGLGMGMGNIANIARMFYIDNREREKTINNIRNMRANSGINMGNSGMSNIARMSMRTGGKRSKKRRTLKRRRY